MDITSISNRKESEQKLFSFHHANLLHKMSRKLRIFKGKVETVQAILMR